MAEEDKSEAELKMELQRKKQQEKEEEEMKEFQEQRAAEKEKELEEIQQLKERREQRKRERAEEEKRLAEQRAAEDQKKKTDENFNPRDVYVRHRVEEESLNRWVDHCTKQLEVFRASEAEGNKPKFTVQKSGEAGGMQNDDNGLPRNLKSKEELEAEKADALKQRIQPLHIDGLSQGQLEEKAKELWNTLYRIESDKYDLDQRFKRQRDDMAELAERARQAAKGGVKKTATPRQEPDANAEKFTGAPMKVQMYSPYERVKDRRSFVERRDVFTGPLIAPDAPKPELKEGATTNGAPQTNGETAAN